MNTHPRVGGSVQLRSFRNPEPRPLDHASCGPTCIPPFPVMVASGFRKEPYTLDGRDLGKAPRQIVTSRLIVVSSASDRNMDYADAFEYLTESLRDRSSNSEVNLWKLTE